MGCRSDNVIENASLDKGYDSNAIRERLEHDGVQAVIPPKSNRIERFFNKLKQFRRIATRYDKY
jgi:putative transposase